MAFPNDSFSLRFTDCHKIGGNKKDIESVLEGYVQTCLFICDSLSFIYYLIPSNKHIYVHTWKINRIGWPLKCFGGLPNCKGLIYFLCSKKSQWFLFVCVVLLLQCHDNFPWLDPGDIGMVEIPPFSFGLLGVLYSLLVARVRVWYNILSVVALFFLAVWTLKSRFWLFMTIQ